MTLKKNILGFFIPAMMALPFTANAGSGDYISALTEENISQFLEETRTLASSSDMGFYSEDRKAYFTRHIAPKAKFTSKTRFELPGYPVKEGEMSYDKEVFIQNVTDGNGTLEEYSVEIDIEEVDISNSGRSATVRTNITETGRLPWPNEQGGEKLIPVKGTTACEQGLAISPTNYIQMTSANCETQISFSPFEGDVLGE